MMLLSAHGRIVTIGFSVALLGLALAGCRRTTQATGPVFVCTTPATAAIVREIVGDRGKVVTLLPAGASPHTYEPRPSDVQMVQNATALFSVSPNLDAWASKLPAKQTRSLMEYVPENLRLHGSDEHHEHEGATSDVDPHFWTDPLTVRAIVPNLVAFLMVIDPDGRAEYEINGDAFRKRLTKLDAEIAAMLKPVRGSKVALFHPSVMYMLKRYGIEALVILEPSPGQEPSARDMVEMAATAKRADVKAIFTEPQLPRRPAEVLGEATGIKVAELDPLGGDPDTTTYEDLIRHNAKALRDALQ